MRLPARLWFRRLHLVLGLALGAVLAVVAGSGAALVFRDEIKALDPAARQLASTWDGVADMGFAAARAHARSARPDHTLQVLWFPTEARPYYSAAYRSPDGEEYAAPIDFHPATGTPVETVQSPVLDWITNLHVDLHLGAPGAFLVRWCTLLFSLVLLTGLYLWWPGLKPHLWPAIRKGKLRLWDAHRVLGFAATVPLLLMIFSGVVMAFPAARQAVFLATFTPPPESTGVDPYALLSTPPADLAAPLAAAADDEALLATARELSPPDAFVFLSPSPSRPTRRARCACNSGIRPSPTARCIGSSSTNTAARCWAA